MRDVIILGGGPAGLQAALTLGRLHRSVLLLDAGRYRNDPADHMHNFLAQDGTPPAELRHAARADLEAYDTVEVRDASADQVSGSTDDFSVRLADGSVEQARRIVLATGLRDEVPDVPGLAELWHEGDLVAHCPFCHGHEMAGRVVGVLGAERAGHLVAMMGPVAASLVVLDDDEPVDPAVAASLAERGASLVAGKVDRVERSADGLVAVVEGEPVALGGLFVGPTSTQAAPFAAQLGLTTLPSGGVEVDPMGRTSAEGVFAAGDMAHEATLPMAMAAVLVAAASGLKAGAACVQSLL
ncbi:NAD(P)/FAD-dependent oxidoreductase [Aeromicrobium sp. IC_218]|uniref:NAD(P)/FAD-dependent oxidoreductase n=1 Tax=Aeromicrobium sp. IC_218 TaxID=2545468 RepID=UPI0010392DDC|nr:NAD(P)/FAD-dependent oxidoreductase [Aeromicrobium sp. IC_218]TCI96794.1 NAD(P)/FAD-dependent oxidoreductase [Aeromicrobium sp. IC_218]